MNTGKIIRLRQLMPGKRALIVPVDDGLSAGPEGGLRNIRDTLASVISGGADAILCFPGLLSSCHETIGATPAIVNLTASTTLGNFNEKVQVGEVEHAVRLGAVGVSVHVNISSRYETGMLRTLGRVAVRAESLGVPLLAHIYPRGESGEDTEHYTDLLKQQPRDYARLVRHAARIAVELGADIVKVPYTGNGDLFGSVVDSCAGVAVVCAGGPHNQLRDTLIVARSCIDAGAHGVSFGRRVFDSESPERTVDFLRQVVHGNARPDDLVRELE